MTSSGTPQRAHPPNPRPQSSDAQPESQRGANAAYRTSDQGLRHLADGRHAACQTETVASRAAVQRNLDLLAQRGLIREITGQGRYMVWTATAFPT